MTFKYFDKPELFAVVRDSDTKCDTCGQVKLCFDAEGFKGQDEFSSICFDCLASGRLLDKAFHTCNGDIAELKRQLKALNPALTDLDIAELARQKTTELEKTTPCLVTWQDWDWPCSDGDYCKFIGFGSRPFYNSLATTTGEELFKTSFYYNLKDDSDIDFFWDEVLPDEEIKNFKDSNQYGTLFYVFKSLNSDNIITIWDCD